MTSKEDLYTPILPNNTKIAPIDYKDELHTITLWKNKLTPILDSIDVQIKPRSKRWFRILSKLSDTLCVRVINKDFSNCIEPEAILQSKILEFLHVSTLHYIDDYMVPQCHEIISFVQLASACCNICKTIHERIVTLQTKGASEHYCQRFKHECNVYVNIIKLLMKNVQSKFKTNIANGFIDWETYKPDEIISNDDLCKWVHDIELKDIYDTNIYPQIPKWYNNDVLCFSEKIILPTNIIDKVQAYHNLQHSLKNKEYCNKDIYSLKNYLDINSKPLLWLVNKNNEDYTLTISNIEIHSIWFEHRIEKYVFVRSYTYGNPRIKIQDKEAHFPSVDDITYFLANNISLHNWYNRVLPFTNPFTRKYPFYNIAFDNYDNIYNSYKDTHFIPPVKTFIIQYSCGLLYFDINWTIAPKPKSSTCVIQ